MKNINTDDFALVNQKTGWSQPIEAGTKIVWPEDAIHAKERRDTERKKQYRYVQTDELGKYILLRVKKLPTNLDPSTLARLTLLSTYIDYNNRLMVNKQLVMRKNDLPRILNISERAARDFVSEVKNKYLILRDGEMYLSKEYYRGESDKYKRDAKQKLFIQTTQDLYYKLKPREHRYFGYVIRIVPFINREFNILCHNPDEVVFDQIKPLSIGEICDILEYENSHSDRLLDGLTRCIFRADDQDQSLCAIVQSVGNGITGYGMFVNPRILYNGSDYNKVEILHFYFPLRKNRCYHTKKK